MADPDIKKNEPDVLAKLTALIEKQQAAQGDTPAAEAAPTAEAVAQAVDSTIESTALEQQIEAQGVEDAGKAEALLAEITAGAPPKVEDEPKPEAEGPVQSSEVPQLKTVRMEVPEELAKA